MNPNVDMSGCEPHAPPPKLCGNGCGYFGSPENRGLCSTCYKNQILRQKTSKIESTIVTNSPPPSSDDSEIKVSEESEIAAAPPTSLTDSVDPPAAKNRCGLCRKKLGVLGFACRCGGGYCNMHRLPEAHDCRFDYKGAGKVVIEDQNPLVKADKMTRRI